MAEALLEKLSDKETKALERAEKKIEKFHTHFFEVGRALVEIRDSKLYREMFPTFEAYCKKRWDMSRPRAYQLIDAAEVYGELSTTVDTLPQSERQIRPLSKLRPGERKAIWEQALEETEDEQPTADHIEELVKDALEDCGLSQETLKEVEEEEKEETGNRERSEGADKQKTKAEMLTRAREAGARLVRLIRRIDERWPSGGSLGKAAEAIDEAVKGIR